MAPTIASLRLHWERKNSQHRSKTKQHNMWIGAKSANCMLIFLSFYHHSIVSFFFNFFSVAALTLTNHFNNSYLYNAIATAEYTECANKLIFILKS